LRLARQKREIASLERRLASATKVEDKPFYLEALEILTEEAKNRENQQMKLDIAKLKGKAGIREADLVFHVSPPAHPVLKAEKVSVCGEGK
jgi:hypothetical protein